MREGNITYWNAQKGYGFIAPTDDGEDAFFHVSSWQSKTRPSKGEFVKYHPAIDKKNRPVAENVRLATENKKISVFKKIMETSAGRRLPRLAVVAVGLVIALFMQFFTSSINHDDRQINREFHGVNDTQIVRTLALIEKGGPFPYPDRDGSVFQNREKRLPVKPRGYYREYTVPTPEATNRGARRIVTGGNPPEVFYYTADHYDTFQQLEMKR